MKIEIVDINDSSNTVVVTEQGEPNTSTWKVLFPGNPVARRVWNRDGRNVVKYMKTTYEVLSDDVSEDVPVAKLETDDMVVQRIIKDLELDTASV